jgi:hypothetical protein
MFSPKRVNEDSHADYHLYYTKGNITLRFFIASTQWKNGGTENVNYYVHANEVIFSGNSTETGKYGELEVTLKLTRREMRNFNACIRQIRQWWKEDSMNITYAI